MTALGLLASIGTLLAENQEKLLTPGQGDIYSLFESAANVSYKANRAEQDFRLQLEHAVDDDKLRSAVAAANALCDELHGLVIRTIGSRDAVPPFLQATLVKRGKKSLERLQRELEAFCS